MRFVGIDVAAEHHVVAGVDETGAVDLVRFRDRLVQDFGDRLR